MRRSITALALAVIMAVTMSAQNTYKPLTRDGYVDYLYKYMPLPDSLANPRSFWEEAVDKTLEVRDRMKWGVPEKEFRHFVLPLRVNNEDLDRFRALYADELCERVKGMSLHDAALEINHWCHEWVTYVGTDARTRGPLATMRSGEGRCGEESTFTVSALRAAGIPARQVYTPLWAHTDSNHAWVEAWVDGKWYFLGACEPDPELNMGWFSGPVSRALLLHTKVSGDYKGDEDIIVKNPVYTEINVIKNYVPTRSTTVMVVSESGAPVPGVEVEYKIFNYGDFGNVCKITTDKAGQAKLATGKGDMLVWAAKGDRFGFAKLDREDVTIRLDKKKGDVFSLDLDMVPPAEDPLPNNATKEQIDANSKRLAQEDVIRKGRHTVDHVGILEQGFYSLVGEKCPEKEDAAKVLFKSMSAKDLGEYGVDVLFDALDASESSDPMILSPRISTEALIPCRKEIKDGLSGKVTTPEELMSWIKKNIKIVGDERNPQGLKIPPVYVWRSRMSDKESANIFFVAACRALGWPARLDAGSRVSVMKDGVWTVADLEGAVAVPPVNGDVKIVSAEGVTPRFGEFSVSTIENGRTRRAGFRMPGGRGQGRGQGRQGAGPRQEPKLEMEAGYHMVTTGKRLSDGSVLARISTFNVEPGKVNEIPVSVRSEEETPLAVIGHIDSGKISGKDKFILAVVKENGEPTLHVLRQLEGDSNAIIVKPGDASYETFKTMIEEALGADPKSVPYVIVADKAGNVYYFSQGYNTVLRDGIDRVFPKIH